MSPTPAERAALKVADAAAMSPASAYGLPNAIVFALGAAHRLTTPEEAAELSRLQSLMNAQPADLSEAQVKALGDAGNRAVADQIHEDVCHCSQWPSACVSGHTVDSWDTGAWDTGVPAVIGLWEVLRSADTVGEVAVLNAALAESRERAAEAAGRVSALRARNAELEALVLASGAAAEQRHQVYDPSEPPVGCFMTGAICALALADALAPHPEPCRFPSGPDCTCVPLAVTS